jgi:hypothetical protein
MSAIRYQPEQLRGRDGMSGASLEHCGAARQNWRSSDTGRVGDRTPQLTITKRSQRPWSIRGRGPAQKPWGNWLRRQGAKQSREAQEFRRLPPSDEPGRLCRRLLTAQDRHRAMQTNALGKSRGPRSLFPRSTESAQPVCETNPKFSVQHDYEIEFTANVHLGHRAVFWWCAGRPWRLVVRRDSPRA